MEKAVLDRISEGKFAVLLVGESEVEYVLDKSALPEEAKAGSHLLVDIQSEKIMDIKLDTEATISARERIKSKMEMIRKRQRKGN